MLQPSDSFLVELNKRPMLQAAGVLIVSILTYRAFPTIAHTLVALLLAAILSTFYFLPKVFLLPDRLRRHLPQVIVLSVLVALATFLPYAKEKRMGLWEVQPCRANVEGRVDTPAVSKDGYLRYELRVDAATDASLVGRKILLYMSAGPPAYPFVVGDRMAIKLNVKPTREFLASAKQKGFGHYLLARSISAVCYAEGGAELLAASTAFSLRVWSQKTKQTWQETLSQLPVSQEERAVLATLTLGRAEMGNVERRLQKKYSLTGASHLLSVSGYHLGVIAAFVMLLLTPLYRMKNGYVFARIVTVFFIWLFTLLTGCSEPTMRAALMLTLLLLARLVGRPTDSLNLLAFSALLILCFSPYAIYSIGFGLSYAAVASIILYYPLLYKLIPGLKNPVVRGLWGVISVGLSAQALCLPLCLYYFGENALLGALTNVPLTLLSTLLIPTALLWMIWTALVGSPPIGITEILAWLSGLNTQLVEKLVHVEIPLIAYEPSFFVVLLIWSVVIYLSFRWQRFVAVRR